MNGSVVRRLVTINRHAFWYLRMLVPLSLWYAEMHSAVCSDWEVPSRFPQNDPPEQKRVGSSSRGHAVGRIGGWHAYLPATQAPDRRGVGARTPQNAFPIWASH